MDHNPMDEFSEFSDFNDEMMPAAVNLRATYNSLILAGFSESQAMTLVGQMIAAALKAGGDDI